MTSTSVPVRTAHQEKHDTVRMHNLDLTNKEVSQILNDALAFQDEEFTRDDFDWRKEEEIENEIASFLVQIEKQNVAETFKRQMRDTVVSIVQKVSKKVYKKVASQKASQLEDRFDMPASSTFGKIDESRDALKDADRSSSPEAAQKTSENLAIVMLQKKIANLKKQVELAEQKARSATLQW